MSRTIKYTGGGDFIPGVPARDLSHDEYVTHKEAIAANAAATGTALYEVPADEVEATPAAKEAATEKGVNLVAVKGSGEGGRILKSDVTAAADSAATEGSE